MQCKKCTRKTYGLGVVNNWSKFSVFIYVPETKSKIIRGFIDKIIISK